MFKLMFRIQNKVLAVAGIATAGLFGISVTDIKGCAQSSEIHSQEISADMRVKIMRKLKIGSTLSNRSLPGDRIDEIIHDYATTLARAEQEGLGVSDHELGLFLHQQFGGKENYAKFRGLMQQRYGLVASELEDYFRDQLLMSKSSRLPLLSTYVTNAEIKEEYHRRHDKLVYDRLAIEADAMAVAEEPTEAELKAYHEENSTSLEYQVPEKVAIEYVMVSPESIPEPKLSDEDLRQYYNLHREDYKSDDKDVETKPYFEVVEDVRSALEKKLREDGAKKILNDIDNVILEQTEIKLLATFESLKAKQPDKYELVKAGTSPLFTEREYRIQGLGYVFNLGSRVFGENPRPYGGVLEAGDGFYIYHVVDRQMPRAMTYEEAKDQVAETLKTKNQLDAAEALAKTWKEKVIASTDWGTLELPEGMSYRVEESEGIASSEANRLKDLEIGVVTDPETVGQSVLLMRLKERVVAETEGLESEKDEIKENLQRQKGYQLSAAMNR